MYGRRNIIASAYRQVHTHIQHPTAIQPAGQYNQTDKGNAARAFHLIIRLRPVLLGQVIHDLDIARLGLLGGDMADFLPGVVLVFRL